MLLKNDMRLDIKTSSCLKGILACMVLICHLHGKVDLFSTNILGTLFSAFGYLAVSVFFFLSGYGLRESLYKKEDYIQNFPRKKLLPFFCICCFTILIYFIRDICTNSDIDILAVIQSFLFGKTIVDNGWYLQSQLIFYLMFYLIYRFVKVKRTAVVILVFASYCVLCSTVKMHSTWYEASLCFPLGLFYSEHKNKAFSFFFKNRTRIFINIVCVFIMFMLTLFFGNKPFLVAPIRISIKMISSLFFVLLTLIMTLLINVKNIITDFLGKISLEIYLLQGIFLNLFKKQFLIENDWLYMLVVIICTLMFSVLFRPIYEHIGSVSFKRYLNRS